MDDDDDYFYQRSYIRTQKMKYKDVTKHHQLKDVKVNAQWVGSDATATINSGYRIRYSQDDGSFSTIFTREEPDGDAYGRATREDDGTQFNIGLETQLELQCFDGTKIREFSMGISPRKNPYSE
jgi:hypothetical protein